MMAYKRFAKCITQPVSALGLGFGLGGYNQRSTDYHAQCAVLRQALDAGINFIDTAPVYGDGASEVVLGTVLKDYPRDKVLVATKVGPKDLSASALKASVARSLKRLQTDYIDLLQIHWPNPEVPFAESLSAMQALVDAGLIRAIGVGNLNEAQFKTVLADAKNTPLLTIQQEYNLFERSVTQDIYPMCLAHQMTLIAYSPLLQGRIVSGQTQRACLTDLAQQYGLTPGQLALKWLMHHEQVLPIPNTTNPERLMENIGAVQKEVPEAVYDVITTECAPSVASIPVNQVQVATDTGRAVYTSITEAKENKLELCPSPMALAERLKQGDFLKPVRVRQHLSGQYELIEGRLRYWAWVLAFGQSSEIDVLIVD